MNPSKRRKLSNLRKRRRDDSSSEEELSDSEWIVYDEEADLIDYEITDLQTILESYGNFERIVIEGVKTVLGHDAPSRKIIEDVVKNFLGPVHNTLCGDKMTGSYSNLCSNRTSRDMLRDLEEEIDNSKPSVSKIISSKLTREDKKYCLKLYKIYENLDPFSEDKLRIEEILQNKIKYGQTLNEEDVDKFETIEKSLQQKDLGIHTLKERILSLEADDKNKLKIYKKYGEFEVLSPSDSSYQTMKEWLEWAVRLPFEKRLPLLSDPTQNISEFLIDVRKHFDKKIFGMEKIKDHFLIFIHDLYLGLNQGKNLILEGTSGTGKTLVSKVCAEALKWPFYKISCGGLEDPSFIRGQDTAWVGSSPSVFVQALCHMKCSNGILLLDEIDKMSQKSQEALLDVIDRTTNDEWRDAFLSELTIDMKGIMIVATANDWSMIIAPLRDRFLRIHVNPHNEFDERIILSNYVLPSILQDRKLNENSIKLSEDALLTILRKASEKSEDDRKGGSREAKMILTNIIERTHFLVTTGSKSKNLNLEFSLRKRLRFPITLRKKDIEDLSSS